MNPSYWRRGQKRRDEAEMVFIVSRGGTAMTRDARGLEEEIY